MDNKRKERGRGNDLYPAKVREIPRTPGDDAGYVEAVARLVMDEADKAISWYLEKKVPKKLGAQALRLAAIVAATVRLVYWYCLFYSCVVCSNCLQDCW